MSSDDGRLNGGSHSRLCSRRRASPTSRCPPPLSDRTTASSGFITRAPQVFDGLDGSEAGVLLDALRDLALIIVATVAVFLVLRRFGKAFYGRMGASARDSGILRTVLLFLASAVIDALIVVAGNRSAKDVRCELHRVIAVDGAASKL